MEFDRSRIKEKAKAILHQAYPRPWKVTLVFQLLFFALPLALLFSFTLLIQILFRSSPAERLIQGFVSSGATVITVLLLLVYPALLILMMLLGAGYHYYALRLWRRESGSYRDLFRGFSMVPRFLALLGLIVLFSLLWFLPAIAVQVGSILLFQRLEDPVLLNALAVPLLLGLWAFWFSRILRYALSLPVLLDHPEYTARQALNRSKELMVGQRWRLVVFLLSFLGWMLLISLIAYVVLLVSMLLLGYFLPEQMLYYPTLGSLALMLLGVTVPAWLASAPLALWLNGYVGVSLAGVYDRLQGAPSVPSTPPWQPQPGEPGQPE